jgi:hypothetical protein
MLRLDLASELALEKASLLVTGIYDDAELS